MGSEGNAISRNLRKERRMIDPKVDPIKPNIRHLLKALDNLSSVINDKSERMSVRESCRLSRNRVIEVLKLYEQDTKS